MYALREKSHKAFEQWRMKQYLPVSTDDESDSVKNKRCCPTYQSKATIMHLVAAIGSIFLFLALLSLYIYFDRSSVYSRCKKIPRRREWRALGVEERENFVQAVNCLSTIPSSWRHNGTIYDDFTYLHGSIGSWSHRSAAFLPWHRYTLHLWERALRSHCGFKGQIPYWDWSLDWMNLSKSSIWDTSTGFGGDGDRDSPISVGDGHCVIDGPFSRLRPIMYNHTFSRHCLSRGFRDGNRTGRLPDTPFSPESIGRILQKTGYEELRESIEYKLHNVMHTAIAGDFLALTAANDPIFFVHHAQLDRLWWQWQIHDLDNRQAEYEGKHMFNSTGPANVEDMLLYGGFAEDIPVSSVMDTQNGFLCYTY